jgi:hypothetical protein
MLARFAAMRALAEWFGEDDLLLLKVRREREGVYVWHLRVFEHLGGGDYRLHAADLPQAVFAAERIRGALRARFRSVRTYDLERARPSPRSERLYFVCRA